jgi:hypothetical protein
LRSRRIVHPCVRPSCREFSFCREAMPRLLLVVAPFCATEASHPLGHLLLRPGTPRQASPSPPSSRSTLLNFVDAVLDIDTTLALLFLLYLSSIYMMINPYIYACVVPSCRSIPYAMMSILRYGIVLLRSSFVLVLVCLCCLLWTEPSSRSRDRTSLDRLGCGFIPPWPRRRE